MELVLGLGRKDTRDLFWVEELKASLLGVIDYVFMQDADGEEVEEERVSYEDQRKNKRSLGSQESGRELPWAKVFGKNRFKGNGSETRDTRHGTRFGNNQQSMKGTAKN